MTDRWTEGGDAFKEAIEGQTRVHRPKKTHPPELKRTCSEDQEIKVVVLTRHGSGELFPSKHGNPGDRNLQLHLYSLTPFLLHILDGLMS